MLFNRLSILDVLQSQKQKLKEKIQSLQANYLLSASEQDLIAWIVDEFKLDVPEIDESKIETEHRETQIDVSGDPQRMIFDRSRPFYMPGTEVTFILPFTGDAAFFEVQPQHFTYSSSGSKASVMNGEIRFTYANANLNAVAAKREFEGELQHIKQNLQNLKASVNQHNGRLEQEIRQLQRHEYSGRGHKKNEQGEYLRAVARTDQRVQVTNHEVLTGGQRVAQQLHDNVVHSGRMKYPADERHQQQDKREERQDRICGHGEGKGMYLGA